MNINDLSTGFGLIGGTAATYTAIKELATAHFSAPCYIRPFVGKNFTDSTVLKHLNCCGRWQNITRLDDQSQCNAYRDFYGQN